VDELLKSRHMRENAQPAAKFTASRLRGLSKKMGATFACFNIGLLVCNFVL